MVYLLITHVVGIAGGLLAKKFRVPAGAMLGAIAFIVVLNVSTGFSEEYPVALRVGIQITSGIIFGLTFTRADVLFMRRLFKSVLMLAGIMIGLNVLFSFIMAQLTFLTPITALLAAAPAGFVEMGLMAGEVGADAEYVALLQIFRFIFVVSVMPFVVRRVLAKSVPPSEQKPVEAPKPEESAKKESPPAKGFDRKKILLALLTVFCATAGGLFARWLGVPAGGIIGSITATILLNAGAQKAWFPRKRARVVVQIFAGCYIGSLFTTSTLASLQFLVLPMAILIVQLLLMTFLTAAVLTRFSPMDKATCLFSSVPGGVTEMGIIAEEMGLDVPKIIMMQTCRLVVVIFTMPFLLYLLFG